MIPGELLSAREVIKDKGDTHERNIIYTFGNEDSRYT